MIGRGRDLSVERDAIRVVVRTTEEARLDRFLIRNLAWRSRSRLQRLIRQGHITVNGEPAKPSRRVRLDDVVVLRLSSGTGVPGDYSERTLETIYEDRWLLALNKPPDLLVHPVGRHVYDTLINYLHHRYHGRDEDGQEVVPRLCHRLDRDTTGVVVVAKDAWIHRDVMGQFEGRSVEKSYLTLVRGCWPDARPSVELAIGEGRCLRSSLEHPVLKPSLTAVEILRRFRDYTLLRCRPRTGRQNQIRIHLSACGHPVAGDVRFGDLAPAPGHPPRHLLHAERLRFWHPGLKSSLELEARPPADFSDLLGRLVAGKEA